MEDPVDDPEEPVDDGWNEEDDWEDDWGDDDWDEPVAAGPMYWVGTILQGIGSLIAFGFWIWLVVVAFRSNVMWGVALLVCSCVPLLPLIFAVQHWEDAKYPFLGSVAGNILAYGGAFLAGSSMFGFF